jgi:hypothetical protein
MALTGEIIRIAVSTPAELIDEVKTALVRSRTKAVFGYRTADDAAKAVTVAGPAVDNAVVVITLVFGEPAIDDFDAPVTRENGTTSSPLYELEQPQRWPEGLFEKLAALSWVIDSPINVLDVIADRV